MTPELAALSGAAIGGAAAGAAVLAVGGGLALKLWLDRAKRAGVSGYLV